MATQCQRKFGFIPYLAGAKFQFIPRHRAPERLSPTRIAATTLKLQSMRFQLAYWPKYVTLGHYGDVHIS